MLCNYIILPYPLPAFYIAFSNKQNGANQYMKHEFDALQRSLRFHLPPHTSASFLSSSCHPGVSLGKCKQGAD